jgi:hypothetical protein
MFKQHVLLILFIILSRILPHPPNLTPINSVSVYCGAKLRSYCVPVIGMLLSDIIIGFHPLMLVVYPVLILSVYLSTKLNFAVSIFINSFIFFVTTNFFMWVLYYEHTVGSLIQCYILAIPFYQYSLIGDLLYSLLLFGLGSLVDEKYLQLSKKANNEQIV